MGSLYSMLYLFPAWAVVPVPSFSFMSGRAGGGITGTGSGVLKSHRDVSAFNSPNPLMWVPVALFPLLIETE